MNAIEVLSSLVPIEMDAGIVFSGKASGTKINGYAQPCAYTPKADSSYIFHNSTRDVIVWLLNPVEPLYIYGPLGCGKSSQILQIAARLNYPVLEIAGHGDWSTPSKPGARFFARQMSDQVETIALKTRKPYPGGYGFHSPTAYFMKPYSPPIRAITLS